MAQSSSATRGATRALILSGSTRLPKDIHDLLLWYRRPEVESREEAEGGDRRQRVEEQERLLPEEVQAVALVLCTPVAVPTGSPGGCDDSSSTGHGSGAGRGWQADRDVHSEVHIPLSTARKLRVVSGTFVTIRAAASLGPDARRRPVRAVVHPDDSCNTAGQRTFGEIAEVHAHGDFSGAKGRHDVALLPPSLAAALNLPYHLQPLLQADGAEGPWEERGAACQVVLEAGVPEQAWASGREQVTVGIPQAVRGEMQLPVAAKMTFKPVREPALHPLAQAGTQAPANKPASFSLAAPKGPAAGGGMRSGSSSSSRGSGDGEPRPDSPEAQEAVLSLRRWLRCCTRLLAVGDVVAVPQLHRPALRSLAGVAPPAAPRSPAGVLLLQVAAMLPAELQVAAAEEAHTAVELLGQPAAAPLPVGLVGYAQAELQLQLGGPLAAPAAWPCENAELGKCAGAAWAATPSIHGLPLAQSTWRDVGRVLAPAAAAAAGESGRSWRASVLLHGPRGSGKTLAVQAAAAAMGLRLLPFNCWELSGNSAGTMLEVLKVVGELCRDHAPCVLLLEHLNALASAASGPSGASASAALQHSMSRHVSDWLLQMMNPSPPSAAPPSAADRWPSPSQQPDPSPRRRAGPQPLLPVLVVGTCSELADLPAPVRRAFTHEVEAKTPDDDARARIVSALLRGRMRMSAEHVSGLVQYTAGMLPRDIAALCADILAEGACAATRCEPAPRRATPQALVAENGFKPALESAAADGKGGTGRNHGPGATACATEESAAKLEYSAAVLDAAAARSAARRKLEITTASIPSVLWSDVGGLEHVKKAIMDTIELPLKQRHMFHPGLHRRSGILLYGPPGTGKTLIAKAVATECALNFLSVKGPELINQWIGESERHVRAAFSKARQAAPCVLFFDELDSLAPARGATSDSGGVMDRIVSQLLAEVDALHVVNEDVFVIGATNRPDLLDPAMLRPGRFDVRLFVGVPSSTPARLNVLRALTRKFTLGSNVDLEAIAAACGEIFTGADLYAVCADAWMMALKQQLADRPDVDDDEGIQVVVSQQHLVASLKQLRPSLSPIELLRYDEIRAGFEQAK